MVKRMSSVLIKGMEMPKNCDDCFFIGRGYPDWCSLPQIPNGEDEIYDTKKRPDWCPLVELPEKHGRLVDADALHTLFENQWHYLQCLNWDENPTAEAKQTGINWCINTLHDDAKTIIEAEEDEE